MSNRTSSTVALVLLAFLVSASSHAVTIIEHLGSADPETEGWTLSGIGAGSTQPGNENTTSGNYDYWRVYDGDSCLGCTRNYTFGLSPTDLASDWQLDARLRIVNSPTLGQAIILFDGITAWSFYFDNATTGPVQNNQGIVHPVSLDATADYHLYTIKFSHNGVGTADDTADFFIDGQLVLNDIGRSGLNIATTQSVFFGGIGSQPISDAHYEFVRFSVPEPMLGVLLASGLVALARSRRSSGRDSALS